MPTETKPDSIFFTYFLIHMFCWGSLFASSIFSHWPTLVASAVGLAVSAFMLWLVSEED